MQAILLGVSFALLSVIWWPTPYALAANAKVVRGTIVAIGGASLTVKVREQEMKFSVDPKTVVEARGAGTKARAAQASGGPGPKLADVLKAGDAVAVTYHEVNGAFHASRVRAVLNADDARGGGAPVAAAAAMTAIGTVQSVGANSISISGAGGGGSTFTQTFVIDRSTKVYAKGAGTATEANGGRVAFRDLVAAGDRVSVSYRKQGDELYATGVRVTAKATH